MEGGTQSSASTKMKLGRAAAAVERWSDESSSTAAILLPLRAGATTLLSTRAPRAGRSALIMQNFARSAAWTMQLDWMWM